jgi:flagellar basal body-associated protein FliL
MSKSKKYSNQQGKSSNRLPLVLLVVGSILLAGAVLFALLRSNQPASPDAPAEVSGSPSLKVDREVVDFGDVPLDQPVSVTFQLSNVGDQPLRFSQEPFIEVAEGC